MKYDVEIENDDAERIAVRDKNVTIDDGEWTFTKTIEEWLDLAIDDDNKRVAASKGLAYDV